MNVSPVLILRWWGGSDRIVIDSTVLKFDKSKCFDIFDIVNYLIFFFCVCVWNSVPISELCLCAAIKKGHLFWSSSALPSAENLGTVHSKPLSSLQTEVPAETIATHPNMQIRYMVSWKLFGKQTKKHTQILCTVF